MPRTSTWLTCPRTQRPKTDHDYFVSLLPNGDANCRVYRSTWDGMSWGEFRDAPTGCDLDLPPRGTVVAWKRVPSFYVPLPYELEEEIA